jgi:hypothetical protein
LYEKNKFIGFFADAAKSWKDLSEEERSKYINQTEQAQHAHEVKKDEDKNHKAKSAFYLFMADQKDNYPKNEPQDELLKWCYEKWQNSDALVKSKKWLMIILLLFLRKKITI